MNQANELFLKALQALIDKQEKGTRASISVNEKLLSEYKDGTNSSLELGFEKTVSEHEVSGLVGVTRYKGSAGIKSISLKNYDRAIQLLNHTPLSIQVQNSLKAFGTAFDEIDLSYVLKLKELAQYRWEKKSSFLGCYVGDTAKLVEITKAAIAILDRKNKTKNVDYRHFSATYLSHSKCLYDIKGKVADAIKLFSTEDLEGFSSEDILTTYGVVQLNHPVYLSGAVSLKSNDKELNAGFDGGVGVWPTYVEQVEELIDVKAVTTIENQATYERYLQTKSIDEVVLFTSGIPSPSFKRLFKMIVKACQPDTVKHWGDIDIGGFTILNMLDTYIEQPVKAFNMEPSKYLKSYDNFSANELKKLQKMKVSKANEHTLSLWVDCKKKFEQESFKWE